MRERHLIPLLAVAFTCSSSGAEDLVVAREPYQSAIESAVALVESKHQEGLRLQIRMAASGWSDDATFLEVRRRVQTICGDCDSVRVEVDSAMGRYGVEWIVFTKGEAVVLTNRGSSAGLHESRLSREKTEAAMQLAETVSSAFERCRSPLLVSDGPAFFATTHVSGVERSHAFYGIPLDGRIEPEEDSPALAACRDWVSSFSRLAMSRP